MAVILGINAFHAGAAAALVVDGEPIVAMPEERLNRVKYFAGFPALSIRRCLDIAGLEFSDIDAVAVGRDPSANRVAKVGFALRNLKDLRNLLKIRGARGALDDFKTLISSECDVDPAKLRFTSYNVEHHLAHTASAYFMSEWEHAAGFTLDGSGDFVTCLMSECDGPEIKPLHRVYVPHSMGSLYMMVCEFIGYTKYGDEGKVMGLAPLGKDTYRDTFDRMLRLRDTGFEIDLDFFMPFGSSQGMSINEKGEMVIHRHFSDRMIELFGEPREPYSDYTERDLDLAFGVQRVFEKGYMHLLNLLHERVPEERIAMSGGCTLNSVANGKLFDETPFRRTCIQPAAGDDGLALGSALYVSNSVLREGRRWVMRNSFLGPEFDESTIRRELDRAGLAYRRLEREVLLDEVAQHIADARVVGWFQGRMEWGPRALGNRSILAHPGHPDMKDILNARIKHREWFRPFAPSVLEERQGELFEHTHPSPFMLHVYKIKPEWRERLCTVNHVDNTGRLQTVSRDENPLYYDLIRAFEAKTGIPVVLNTSFNENEPIVCEPAEAIDCFKRTQMDVLAVGPFVCTKADA
ncbi:MAG: carbamoyltransferase [Deltaproteobacteria bacterium]|nr:carbamoyltransferase [Deltaproteobacteria bacterium]MDP6073537.1 carbamoyltransferase C-terminal domain-containing protein [Myxococcota bacterium]